MNAIESLPEMSRRGFVITTAAVGGGMMLGFHIPLAEAASVSPQPWTTPTEGLEINAWLTIDPDGIVTVRVPHTEMGQGALTSVSMMVAEELDVRWENVQAVFADPNRHIRNDNEYVTMATAGSRTVRDRHPHIMQAGASARERLKEAAAQAWDVSRSDVTAHQGTLSAGDNTASFGEFAAAAAEIALDEEPAIKTPDAWWLLGTDVPRFDVPLKVNGSAAYAIDTTLPGMVYATVKSCPVPFGRVRSFDFDAIRDRPGIIAAVELRAVDGERNMSHHSDMMNGVAVVADTWYRAKTALDLLPIEWDFDPIPDGGIFSPRPDVSSQSLFEEARGLLDQEGEVSAEMGEDVREILANADTVITATYERPYETHARMEPINATANVTEDRVEVWTPIQDQSLGVRLAADQAGLSTDNSFAHTVFLGGGFGGNGGGGTPVTRQAVEISRQIGRPVKLIWTREEDIMHDRQRPLNVSRYSAVLGDDGLPTAFFTRCIGEPFQPSYADRGVMDMVYEVPNRRHERNVVQSHIPTTWHRAPGTNANGFMIESFVDELARAGDWDPIEWRLAMTRGRPDWQLVLNTMKEVAGYKTDLPRGEGMGIGVVESHGSIVGACATVTVSRRGLLHVEKVTLVVDSGHIINPRNATEQLEGAVAWELSHVLSGGLNIQNGRVVNTNFDNYNLLRIDQMPEVEVHFALSGGEKWGGIGEPAGPPTPPAIANAVYAATGKRVYSTPLLQHDLSWS